MAEPVGRKKRFYWLEGVSRAEVERSLSDTKPSVFRRQGPRRLLVAVSLALIVLLAVPIFVPHPKLASYLQIGALAACILAYLRLRGAVRLVADAPDELLDERQIAARNAAYVVAYRLLAVAALFALGLFMGLEKAGGGASWLSGVLPVLHPHHGDSLVLSLGFPLLMLAACLPSMVMAWKLPDEPAA